MANYNKPTNAFKKGVAKTDEQRQQLSNGQIERSKMVNNMQRLRTLWGSSTIDTELIAGIEEEVQNGRYDNAIKLFNLIKEPDRQDINLTGISVQKIYVTEEQTKEANKHIDGIINE